MSRAYELVHILHTNQQEIPRRRNGKATPKLGGPVIFIQAWHQKAPSIDEARAPKEPKAPSIVHRSAAVAMWTHHTREPSGVPCRLREGFSGAYRNGALAVGYRGLALAVGYRGLALAVGYRGWTLAVGYRGLALAVGYRGLALAVGSS